MEQNYTEENILDIKRFPEKAFSFLLVSFSNYNSSSEAKV